MSVTSVLSDSLQRCELQATRLLYPWGDSPGKDTGVGCHTLLQGIFWTSRWSLGLLHCRRILYCWAPGEAHLTSYSGVRLQSQWARTKKVMVQKISQNFLRRWQFRVITVLLRSTALSFSIIRRHPRLHPSRDELPWKEEPCYMLCECQSLSRVQLFATPRTVARQASLSMGFSRQDYWSG